MGKNALGILVHQVGQGKKSIINTVSETYVGFGKDSIERGLTSLWNESSNYAPCWELLFLKTIGEMVVCGSLEFLSGDFYVS